jgi:long-chain fatty acid transport protein
MRVGWMIGFVLAAMPAFGGGLEFHWPSARAAGLGGACTAISDPSSLPCNPGALAMLAKPKNAAVGLTATAFNESLYQGLPPGVGTGTAAEQETPRAMIPHLYGTVPLPAGFVLGTGLYTPVRMHTEWAEPEQFSGRFIASSSEMTAYDVPIVAAGRLGAFGIGGGVIWRSSSVDFTRGLAANVAGQSREIANVSTKTDVQRSLGFTAGVLFKAGTTFAAGLSHKTKIETDYSGVGTLQQVLTGDTQLDQLIAAAFPFDQDLPVSSSFTFPSQSNAGLMFSPSKTWLFAVDVTRTGWSESGDLQFVYPNSHVLDTTYALEAEDTIDFRGGARYRFKTGPEVRVGYAVEKSPLTDEAISAFMPDADRTTMTAGFGLDWLDVAIGWTTYKQRIVTTSGAGFNGNFRANSWSALLTVTK